MDFTDIAILRQLSHPVTFQWDVRVSYAEVGRALDLDEETVRMRVRRMQDAGVLVGWDVSINPRTFGRETSNVQVSFPDVAAKERALPALLALDGVRFVFDHLGPSATLVLLHEPGPAAERQMQVLAGLAGRPPLRFPVSMPPPTVPLTPADWRLLQALRTDPRRSFGQLAEQVGTSEKTVRRRLARLIAGKVVFIMARVDFGRLDGFVAASFTVAHADPAKRGPADAVLKALPGLIFQWYEGPVSRISFVRRNAAEVEDLRRQVVALPGVVEARLEITTKRHVVEAWLDDLVARHAAGPAGATPPPGARGAARPRATGTTPRSPARPRRPGRR